MADETEKATVREEIRVSGSHLIEKVKDLIRQGNVRKLCIRDEDGDVSLEMPVTVGVIAGGAVTLAAPWLAVLGVIAALVAHVKIEVEREEEPAAEDTGA